MSTLMILGMHRSYTSLTARWLSASGLDIGAALLAGSQGNPDGHFEDLEFLALHERILVANGLPSDGISRRYDRAFDFAGFEALAIDAELVEQAAKLIRSRPAQFGWKDPRTCLFLPMYRELLPSAQSLIVVRHFDQVVRSLLARDKALVRQTGYINVALEQISGRFKSFDTFLGAWVHYNRALLEHAHACDSVVTLDVVSDAHIIANWLARSGFDLVPTSIEAIAHETALFDLGARSFPYDSQLLATARDLFDELRGLSTSR